VRRLEQARSNFGLASECLHALFGGEELEEGDAKVGALLVAETLAMLRAFMKG
jgi:hypothetical protein